MAAPSATGPPLRKPGTLHTHDRAAVHRMHPLRLQQLLLLLQLPTFLLLLASTTVAYPLLELGGNAGGPRGLARGGRRAVAGMLLRGSAGGGVAEGGVDCAPGCELRGNCDRESGRCMCPWGYTGDACDVDQMGVCRQTEDDPGSCGLFFPKNCECMRACYRLYCRYGTDTAKCVRKWGEEVRESPCYLYGNRTAAYESTEAVGAGGPPAGLDPASAQNRSWYPEDHASRTVWFKQVPELYGKDSYSADMVLKDPERVGFSPFHRPRNWRSAPHVAQPLSSCPANCTNGRGVCLQFDGRGAPRCTCRLGFTGPACEIPDAVASCWFDPQCGGRGTCVSGFCHCQRGYWGLGCSRSSAFRPALVQPALPDVRSHTRLRIYMYELPWDIAFPHEMSETSLTRDPMYGAEEFFIKYFLKDNVTRTENPYEANLFFVPALTYFYSDNMFNPQWHVERVMQHVRQQYPFYNRSGGSDHFWFTTADRGPCSLARDLQDSTIKVVNFGMQQRNISWSVVKNKDYGCVQVKRDLVTPPINMSPDEEPFDTAGHYQWLESQAGHDGNRTLLFFFAGGIRDDPQYSGGARQALHSALSAMDPPPHDVKVIKGAVDNYRQLLLTSTFCLAPYGHGWGLRLVQAVQHGCIPVVVQDSVYQPYEDFMPYERFAVRVPHGDIPRIVDVLRSYDKEHVAQLRLGLAHYYRALLWEREAAGMAYEWTLAGLQRRMQAGVAGFLRSTLG